jgi:chromosome segregation ATPase
MQIYALRAAGVALLLLSIHGAALAVDADVRAAREREMLRRTQDALRQSQAENAELVAQKATAEKQADDKLQAAAAQLESTRKASRSAQSALQAQLQSAASKQAELTTLLADANRQLSAIAGKQQQTASELKHTQEQLEASKASNSACEAKNLQLYQYSEELMARYQRKGVWAALEQKEPFSGVKEVRVENLLQEYQSKLDAQRIKPPTQP